jgi:hypothetical protein
MVSKSEIPNSKWFDKLTTLSRVEGQIPMTEIQKFKPECDIGGKTFHCFGHLVL